MAGISKTAGRDPASRQNFGSLSKMVGQIAKKIPWRILIAVGLFVVINYSLRQRVNVNSEVGGSVSKYSDLALNANAKAMRAWRLRLADSCKAAAAVAEDGDAAKVKKELEEKALNEFVVRRDVRVSNENREDHVWCQNAFMDLGSNIGDSVGHFITHGLDGCSPTWLKSREGKASKDEQWWFPRIDVTSRELKVETEQKRNGLVRLFNAKMAGMASEEFCVYGVEGNPAFTERLKALEDYVQSLKPRPVKHLHIHTETVVTEKNGPTKLYLDQVTPEKNFWGSSVLKSKREAKASAEANDGKLVAADVMGVTLSSLVQRTMVPFRPGATEAEKSGGNLLIKMDIEGGEYLVLRDLVKSGVLCDYAKMGNNVTFAVEYHIMSIEDKDERNRVRSNHGEAKKRLEDCGIVFGGMGAMWA